MDIVEESNKILRCIEQNDYMLNYLAIVHRDHSRSDHTKRGYFWLYDGADLKRLGNAIANNTQLESISFHKTSEWTLDIMPLLEGLQRNTTIRKFSLHESIGIGILNECVANNIMSFKQISIYNCDLRDGALSRALAQAIRKCSDLNDLYICMCRVDDASINQLIASGRGLSCLEKLYLLHAKFDDYTTMIEGIEGAKAIATLFQHPSCNITHLNLSSVRLSSESTQIIVSSLMGNTKLDKLELSGSSVNQSGCESIAALLQDPSCNLTQLDLGTCGINNESATKIVNCLANNTKLKELDLSGNSIGRSGYESIANLLQNPNCNINKIVLWSMNDFACEYASLLAQTLIGNTKLKHLDLGYNKIERSGCESIAALLQSPSCNLISLDLGSCGLGSYGWATVTTIVHSLIGNTKLVELGLSGNRIGRPGCESIAALLQDPNSNINKIDLSNSKIDDDCTVFAQALIGNNKLTCLDLSNNEDITESGWNAFSTILSDCSNTTLLSLGKDYGAPFVPDNLATLLKLNLAIDMEPLFELDSEGDERKPKALPYVIDWFGRVKESNQSEEVVNNIDARKLSSIFQFARAMPLKFVPASHFMHPSVVSLIQLKEDRNNFLETKNRELSQKNTEFEKQVATKDAEIVSMREAKEKSDHVLKAKEDEIKDLYGRLDSIVNVAKKRKFPWD